MNPDFNDAMSAARPLCCRLCPFEVLDGWIVHQKKKLILTMGKKFKQNFSKIATSAKN